MSGAERGRQRNVWSLLICLEITNSSAVSTGDGIGNRDQDDEMKQPAMRLGLYYLKIA